MLPYQAFRPECGFEMIALSIEGSVEGLPGDNGNWCYPNAGHPLHLLQVPRVARHVLFPVGDAVPVQVLLDCCAVGAVGRRVEIDPRALAEQAHDSLLPQVAASCGSGETSLAASLLMGALKFLSLSAFVSTNTLESPMAAAARMGLRRMPKNG